MNEIQSIQSNISLILNKNQSKIIIFFLKWLKKTCENRFIYYIIYIIYLIDIYTSMYCSIFALDTQSNIKQILSISRPILRQRIMCASQTNPIWRPKKFLELSRLNTAVSQRSINSDHNVIKFGRYFLIAHRYHRVNRRCKKRQEHGIKNTEANLINPKPSSNFPKPVRHKILIIGAH